MLRPGSWDGKNVLLREVELPGGSRAVWISENLKLFLTVVPA